nr:putative zinc finger, CCHC-type [Tanacetum cinerariifolium]
MRDEMNAVKLNNTWDLVPRPSNSNVLVPSGYFVPNSMLMPPLINLRPGSSLKPSGFVGPRLPNHVCRLKKALYGLKQAPQAWFQHLSSFLISIGFHCSRVETSLFVFKKGFQHALLTGNNDTILRDFIIRLNKEFLITDLGKLNYFLGLEVSYHDSCIFLGQSKYSYDIHARAHLLDAKPVAMPLSTSAYFTSQGTPFTYPTLYRSLVGALHYLTVTILRYVKGTISYGLSFLHATSPTILGYSDADLSRRIKMRRSTYGYSIFIGGNLVSWSAKKQHTVSRSSCESEYRALANTTSEIV